MIVQLFLKLLLFREFIDTIDEAEFRVQHTENTSRNSSDFLSKQMKTRVYHLGEEALYLPIRGLSPLLGLSKPTYSKFSRCVGPLLLYILTF